MGEAYSTLRLSVALSCSWKTHCFHEVLLLFSCLAIDNMSGKMPPLGKHPHAGLCTATILLQGDSIKYWDNIRDIEETAKSGGVVCLHSAGGIVHSEEAHHEDKDESSFTHILYVWFDPGNECLV